MLSLFPSRRLDRGRFFLRVIDLVIIKVAVVDVVEHRPVADWLNRSEVVFDLAVRWAELSKGFYLKLEKKSITYILVL